MQYLAAIFMLCIGLVALLIDGQVVTATVIQTAVAMRNVQVAVSRLAAEAASLSARVHAKWPIGQELLFAPGASVDATYTAKSLVRTRIAVQMQGRWRCRQLT